MLRHSWFNWVLNCAAACKDDFALAEKIKVPRKKVAPMAHLAMDCRAWRRFGE
jgi:hypothetical protein